MSRTGGIVISPHEVYVRGVVSSALEVQRGFSVLGPPPAEPLPEPEPIVAAIRAGKVYVQVYAAPTRLQPGDPVEMRGTRLSENKYGALCLSGVSTINVGRSQRRVTRYATLDEIHEAARIEDEDR